MQIPTPVRHYFIIPPITRAPGASGAVAPFTRPPKTFVGPKCVFRLYSISRVFGQRVFGEINMCELLILKLDLCLNVSDFTSIGQRWIHFLFNEKESSLEPRNSKNQNTFLSWFLVRKTSWRTPAGFSKFPTEISDRDFRPYRIQP